MNENINFLNDISDQIAEDFDKGKPRAEGHHASGCSAVIDGKVEGACLRQTYFKMTNETQTNPTPDGSKLKILFGNLIHNSFQQALMKKYPDMVCEKLHSLKLEGMDLPVVGSPDGFSPSLNTGVELKSTYGAGFYALEKEGAKIEHIMQCQCYIKLTGIPVWQVVYIARDSAMRRKFDVVEQPSLWKSMIERWKALEKHLKDKTVPPRDYTDDTWHCSIKPGLGSYCPFANRCGVVPLPEKVKKSKKEK